MWNPNPTVAKEEDHDSWEVKAFAEDTRNAMGTTWPPRSYTCTFCKREFRSAQALGGHMNVHRRDRARFQQAQPSMKNLNITLSSSSTCLIPSQEHVANGGLCLLYSLPKPNAICNPSSLNESTGNPSVSAHLNIDNFMNSPTAVALHSFNSYMSSSSNTEASTSTNYKSNEKASIVTKRKRNSAAEGIDLELRLGCNKLAS